MKVTRLIYTTRIIILSALAGLGFLTLPSPSMAERERVYKNCAELQKVMNDYNPELTLKNFEKIQIVRRNLDYEVYIVFCNGGIVIDRSIGTICRGYIAYSFSRIGGGANYYSRWGRTEGLPNEGDTGIEHYCRWIK